MATDYQRIYRDEAAAYDRLVAAEDCDGTLGPALAALVPLAGSRVLEVGCGTGRLTRLLLQAGAHVTAFDAAPAMLDEARRRLQADGCPDDRYSLAVADAAQLPVGSGWSDLAVAGWVFGHQRAWAPDTWRQSIAAGLAEMQRTLRPGGVLALFETLGTGTPTPAPSTALAEVYAWLEADQGCRRVVLRTDYAFANPDAAAAAMAFFFGADFADRVRREGLSRVPECTGLWWRRRAP